MDWLIGSVLIMKYIYAPLHSAQGYGVKQTPSPLLPYSYC